MRLFISLSNIHTKRKMRDRHVKKLSHEMYTLEEFATLMEKPEFSTFVNNEMAAYKSNKDKTGVHSGDKTQIIQFLYSQLNSSKPKVKLDRNGLRPGDYGKTVNLPSGPRPPHKLVITND